MVRKKEPTKGRRMLTASDLPPGVRPFWDTAPDAFRIAALLVALVCYCALGTRLRAKYLYDLEPHALLLQLLVIGEPGSGKSFTRPIVKQLMRLLKLKDAEQKRIEQAYHELRKKTSKTKDLPEEPVTCTRLLHTITRAKLVKRADMFVRKYAEPLAFFFFNEELSTMTESNKRAFADLNTLDRLAYDIGAEYGSDGLSDACYNADVDISYCSVFCGTQNALKEYINLRAIEGGNITRKMLTYIDDDQLGEDAPQFRPQTPEEKETVDRTVEQLMAETYADDDTLQPIHVVPMEWMEATVRRWCQEQRTEVLKTGSRAHNCFYKRSSVSAWRMSVMLYHLWGETPEAQPKVIRFYRFMAQYILDGLLKQWGDCYDELYRADHTPTERATLFDRVPDEFTHEQLNEICAKAGLAPGRSFLAKWKKAKLVYQPDPEVKRYVKIKH